MSVIDEDAYWGMLKSSWEDCGTLYDRLWKLQAIANKFVLEGRRSPEMLCKLLQDFVEAERITLTVVGTGLSGAEWTKRLKNKGYDVSEAACNMLSRPDYDEKHRLEKGREYKITFVRGKEIEKAPDSTVVGIKRFAVAEFGDQAIVDLKVELLLLICEKFFDAELQMLGVWNITVLYDPIMDDDGEYTSHLFVHKIFDQLSVVDEYVPLGTEWGGDIAFAFLAK